MKKWVVRVGHNIYLKDTGMASPGLENMNIYNDLRDANQALMICRLTPISKCTYGNPYHARVITYDQALVESIVGS